MIIILEEDSAECYWSIPLEQDAASHYREEYPTDYTLQPWNYPILEPLIMPELHIHLELSSIHDDCQTFYETIQDTIIAKRNTRRLSINDLVSIIDLKAQLFLQHCNYKPLNYHNCMNLDHPFNNFLQVFAL